MKLSVLVYIFTKLGYQVILSPASNHNIYSLGIESIPRRIDVTRQSLPTVM